MGTNFPEDAAVPSPNPIAHVPDEAESGGALPPTQPPGDNRAMALSRVACSHDDLDMNAARKAEDIAITEERTADGPWIWSLSAPTGNCERERTREDVALPGPREVQHL